MVLPALKLLHEVRLNACTYVRVPPTLRRPLCPLRNYVEAGPLKVHCRKCVSPLVQPLLFSASCIPPLNICMHHVAHHAFHQGATVHQQLSPASFFAKCCWLPGAANTDCYVSYKHFFFAPTPLIYALLHICICLQCACHSCHIVFFLFVLKNKVQNWCKFKRT